MSASYYKVYNMRYTRYNIETVDETRGEFIKQKNQTCAHENFGFFYQQQVNCKRWYTLSECLSRSLSLFRRQTKLFQKLFSYSFSQAEIIHVLSSSALQKYKHFK